MFKRIVYLIRDFVIMLSVYFIVALMLQKIFNNQNSKINYVVFLIIFIFHAINSNRKKYKENQD